MNDVLVLNRSWAAVHVADWKRSMCLLYQGSAKAIDVDTYEAHDFDSWKAVSQTKDGHFIYTTTFKILLPDVIVLTVFDKLPPSDVKLTRRNIFERDGFRCAYCGKKFKRELLTFDHVVPKGQGGKTLWTNLVCACQPCNQKKGGRTPEEAGMKLKIVPSKPTWNGKIEIILGAQKRISWQKFIDIAYWNTELEP